MVKPFKHVGVDFHGVIAYPDELMIRLAREWYDVDLSPQECSTRVAETKMGPYYAQMVYRVEHSDLMLQYQLVPGCVEALEYLKSQGLRVEIVSTLDNSSKAIALHFLELHGVRWYDGWLENRGHSKLVAAAIKGVDLLIDDDPENVRYFLEVGRLGIVFDRPCNRDSGVGLPRLRGWEKIKDLESLLWPTIEEI